MKIVILCGGKGTRLREETEYRPKPMVDIGGHPILWHIMKIYAHHGFKDFVMCLGYKGNMIKEYFLNYEAMRKDFTIQLGQQRRIDYHNGNVDEEDFSVTLAETGLETMTGARIALIEKYIDGDTFMVTYGDGVADVDLTALLKFHHAHGRIATMTTVRPSSRFGKIQMQADGKVTEFVEKPRLEDYISGGFFVFNRKIFEYLSTDESCVLETTPLERLTADGQLMGYQHDGFFFAMDTYKEQKQLDHMWNTGNAPWKVWS